MNKYKYIYFIWLLPAAFLFLIIQQSLVYNGLIDTYKNGHSYTAEIVHMHVKQVAAQTNGHMVLRFKNDEGKKIEKSLSMPIEMAGKLQKSRIVPIRYQPGAYEEVVIMTTYKIQKDLCWSNVAMAAVAFLITLVIAISAHRFANKKLTDGDEQIVIDRID
ncbi:MAG TPA: hypothetical protein VJ964_09070 [Balneolaceae bacterium]|nr:hypothetical protein [Balneolaceae bacterium]